MSKRIVQAKPFQAEHCPKFLNAGVLAVQDFLVAGPPHMTIETGTRKEEYAKHR